MRNNKNKLLIIIIIILLIANTVFSSILWFSINHRPNPFNPHSRGQVLLDELHPDSLQKKKIQSLMSEHFVKLDALKEKEKDAKSAFFSLLLTDTVSLATVLNYAEHAAAITIEIDTMVYNHFTKMRSLCNPDQKEKLDRVIQRILIKSEGMERMDHPAGRNDFHEQHPAASRQKNQINESNDFGNELPPPPPPRHHRMPPPQEMQEHRRPHDRHPEEFPDGPPNMPPPGME